jgi:hypothetical protein
MNRNEDDEHDDDDDDDGDNNRNSVQFILSIFTCLLNCPYANYNVNRSKETRNQTQAHKQKAKQDNIYNLAIIFQLVQPRQPYEVRRYI